MAKTLTFRSDISKSLRWTLALSLFAHICLMVSYVGDLGPGNLLQDDSQNQQKIVLKLLSANKKQIVRTQSNKKKSDDAKFLGKENSHFDRQTKAAAIGTYKLAGAGKMDAKDTVDQKPVRKKQKVKHKEVALSDLGFQSAFEKHNFEEVAVQKELKTRKGLKNGDRSRHGYAQSNDFIEDLPLGDFTKLNTQEYQYFGFYDRIREKLEQFWGVNIKEQAQKISKQGRHIASDSNLVTALVISLNGKGEIIDVHLRSTSGVKELDSAAIDAFNQAGPFPNPPKGMLKNGVAVIEWGFVVNT